MSLLAQLAESARLRAARLPPPPGSSAGPRARMIDALCGRHRLGVIAEFKRESPSRGPIRADADAAATARAYARAGAAAVSVLTEPTRFGGSLEDLAAVTSAVDLPVLMKDFVVDERQIAWGAASGASAVLLIVALHDHRRLAELMGAAHEHGLDALVECHDRAELDRALATGAHLIGVNNRDLRTLAVDRSRAAELLADFPRRAVAVAESGYASTSDLESVRGLADAVLVGSALMSAPDPDRLVEELVR